MELVTRRSTENNCRVNRGTSIMKQGTFVCLFCGLVFSVLALYYKVPGSIPTIATSISINNKIVSIMTTSCLERGAEAAPEMGLVHQMHFRQRTVFDIIYKRS